MWLAGPWAAGRAVAMRAVAGRAAARRQHRAKRCRPAPAPAQVGELQRLRTLELSYAECYRADVITRLTALERLKLDYSLHEWPPGLSRLTALRWLGVEQDDTDPALDWDPLAEALPYLQRLTHLGVAGNVSVPHGPSALACLAGLRSLRWALSESGPGEALPPGAWLAGVTRLEATSQVLAVSLPALAAATQLQELSVCPGADSILALALQAPQPLAMPAMALQRLALWAAGAPSLRLLAFTAQPQLDFGAWSALLQLQAQRPALQIGAGPEPWSEPFWDNEGNDE